MELIEELPEKLQPFEELLFMTMVQGLQRFHDQFGDRRAGMTKRSEKSVTHDCCREEAQRLFADTIVHRNLFMIKPLDDVRIKIKALDLNLQPSNISTQMVLAFMKQKLMRLIEGIECEHLILGYQPDPIDVRRSRIFLVKPRGMRFEWVYEMGSAGLAIMPLPIDAAPAPPAPPSRVRLKVASVRQKRESKKE